MPTSQQDKDFSTEMEELTDATIKVSTSALDSAINWISKKLSPADVFDIKDLASWAKDNGFIFEEDIDYKTWAEENGYVKE